MMKTKFAINGSVVRYRLHPDDIERCGSLVQATMNHCGMSLPWIASVTVHGTTGMRTLPHLIEEWGDITISPGLLSEDSYRMVCAACGLEA